MLPWRLSSLWREIRNPKSFEAHRRTLYSSWRYWLALCVKLIPGLHNAPIRLRLTGGGSFDVHEYMTLSIYREIFIHCCYDLSGLSGQSPEIIDIGANTGLFAIRMKQLYPAARLHCYEPCPENYAQLTDNLTASGFRDCYLYPLGVAGTSRRARLYLHNRNLGGHSLAPFSRHHDRHIEVRLVDLPNALSHLRGPSCSLLKLDCEGAEYEILMGCSPDTFSRIERIVFEPMPHLYDVSELLQHLYQSGFHVGLARGLYYAVRTESMATPGSDRPDKQGIARRPSIAPRSGPKTLLSKMPYQDVSSAPNWSCAIFAYNIQDTIVPCLDSLQPQLAGHDCRIHVLMNGCTDHTEQVVRSYARSQTNIRLVSFDHSDKADTWNRYVHDLAPEATVHFLIDGDVTVAPGSLSALIEKLDAHSNAVAVGALPGAGRDRQGWAVRMQQFGRLAGGLYALRGDYLVQLRTIGIRLPQGLIGEDLFLSCLIKNQLSIEGLRQPSHRLVFAPKARFLFHSLSPGRPGDWLAYARRLYRYQIRDYQLMILLDDTQARGTPAIPKDVDDLYRRMRNLPHYRWRGPVTPFNALAVRHIRRSAQRSKHHSAA